MKIGVIRNLVGNLNGGMGSRGYSNIPGCSFCLDRWDNFNGRTSYCNTCKYALLFKDCDIVDSHWMKMNDLISSIDSKVRRAKVGT